MPLDSLPTTTTTGVYRGKGRALSPEGQGWLGWKWAGRLRLHGAPSSQVPTHLPPLEHFLQHVVEGVDGVKHGTEGPEGLNPAFAHRQIVPELCEAGPGIDILGQRRLHRLGRPGRSRRGVRLKPLGERGAVV